MGWLFALAGVLIKTFLTDFASTAGSGLANLLVDGLKSSGHEETATQLKENPTTSTVIAAQEAVAQKMETDTAYQQQVTDTLKQHHPAQWETAEQLRVHPQVISWHLEFEDVLNNSLRMKAEQTRQEYGLSEEQFKVECHTGCPIGGEPASFTYFIASGDPPQYYEPRLTAGAYGMMLYPFLPKNQWAQGRCSNGHTWYVYAEDAQRV